jgi:hypothetical protein
LKVGEGSTLRGEKSERSSASKWPKRSSNDVCALDTFVGDVEGDLFLLVSGKSSCLLCKVVDDELVDNLGLQVDDCDDGNKLVVLLLWER